MTDSTGKLTHRVSAPLTTLGYANQMISKLTTAKIAALLSAVFRLLLAAFALSFAHAVHAQTVTTYVNGTDGTIDGTTTCAAPLVRNFVVGGPSYTVSDVDLGFFATHTWRGDIRLTLQSPDGTRVQLVDGDANNVSGDNLNVLLNDAHAQTVNTDSPTGNHSTAAPPPFANNFSPNASLAAFNGVASAGTWRLEICDIFSGADNGIFRHAELYLTSAPTNYADLSLTKTVSNATPANATAISYTLTVTNAASSPLAASGVQVSDVLPLGFTFVSASGFGTYDNGTGVWNVGSVPIGVSRSITINGTVNATSGATVTNTAEIIASSVPDLDSTVNNGNTGEDDYASVSFTVSGTRTAGTPPTLVCPVGSVLFDWDLRTWTAGSLNNTYAVTGIGDVEYDISSAGVFVNDPAFGGQSPTLSDQNDGGTGTTDVSLHQYLDFANQSQVATTVITLPTAVPGAQFTVYDVDFANNDFADKLTVTGTFNGATVIPTLTNGVVNYVVGNTAIGDGGSSGTSGDGNVEVTFSSPVDTITISYGNHTTAPADPDGQAIAIDDITYCNPQTTLSVTKVSSVVSDPVNATTNPKSIPGAVISYCILVNNPGSATATSIVATDNIPSDLTFVPGTIRSGTSCGTATTVEDDNNTGADESDPFGASISGTTLTMTAGSLGPTDNLAITFQATVD